MLNHEKYEDLIKIDKNVFKSTFKIQDREFYAYRYGIIDKDYYKKGWVYKECRGITFDEEGDLISRPFQKFYNLNENPLNTEENFDWDNVTGCTEKIDGCLINVIVVRSQIYFKTKSGVNTDEAILCQAWYENHPKKEELRQAILRMCRRFYTPIFEFVYPNKHILDYGKEAKLYFIAMRGIVMGDVLIDRKLTLIKDVVNVLGYDIKFKFEGLKGQKLLQAIKKYQKENTTEEGVVVYFSDGKMVKCKTDWYFRLHSIFGINQDKQFFKFYFDKKLDDVKTVCRNNNFDTKLETIDKIENFIYEYITALVSKIENVLKCDIDVDRRKYYEYIEKSFKDEVFSKILISIAMKVYTYKDVNIQYELFNMLKNKKYNIDILYLEFLKVIW